MEWINIAVEWIKCHLGETALILAGIPIIISLGVLAFSARKYVINRKNEIDQKRFENYHQLLDWLVVGRNVGHIMLDSQIGCVYELRNFENYKEVSIRILEGLKETWGKESVDPRLIKEIDITLKVLRHKPWYCLTLIRPPVVNREKKSTTKR